MSGPAFHHVRPLRSFVDKFCLGHETGGREDHRILRDQNTVSQGAIVNSDAAAAGILGSDVSSEVLRNSISIGHLRLFFVHSHSNTPQQLNAHKSTSVGHLTDIIETTLDLVAGKHARVVLRQHACFEIEQMRSSGQH